VNAVASRVVLKNAIIMYRTRRICEAEKNTISEPARKATLAFLRFVLTRDPPRKMLGSRSAKAALDGDGEAKQ
jgi:hypothetical protein